MIYMGARTKSRIIAKTISAGKSDSTYRGLVKILAGGALFANYTQCDSSLIESFAARIPSLISKAKTRRQSWNTKQPPAKFLTTNSFTASNAA